MSTEEKIKEATEKCKNDLAMIWIEGTFIESLDRIDSLISEISELREEGKEKGKV